MRSEIGDKPEMKRQKTGVSDTEIFKTIVGKLFVY